VDSQAESQAESMDEIGTWGDVGISREVGKGEVWLSLEGEVWLSLEGEDWEEYSTYIFNIGK